MLCMCFRCLNGSLTKLQPRKKLAGCGNSKLQLMVICPHDSWCNLELSLNQPHPCRCCGTAPCWLAEVLNTVLWQIWNRVLHTSMVIGMLTVKTRWFHFSRWHWRGKNRKIGSAEVSPHKLLWDVRNRSRTGSAWNTKEYQRFKKWLARKC